MKKLLFIALALTAFTAKAQYFQHTYGTGSPDHASSGFNVVAPAPIGHFIAGWTKSTCLQPLSTITAAYTDPAGNVPGAPFFERSYTLMTPAGQLLHARDAQAFQIPGGFGFGIIGMYMDFSIPGPNNTGIYYLQLDPMGNPLATFHYQPVPGFDVLEISGIAKSAVFGGDVYVAGTVHDNAGLAYPCAMRLNMFNGIPVWTQIYNLGPPANGAWGKDIEENPSAPPFPFAVQAAALVGHFINGPANDGYLLHIDAATGLPLAPVLVFGAVASDDRLISINQALPSVAFPMPGYVLGGASNINGSNDFLFARMDPFFGPLLLGTYDYGFIPGAMNECHDAIQRFNTFGTDEYYLAGWTNPGVIGNTDELVIKLDQFGVPVPGGEFTYGGPNWDMAQKLDQDNAGAPGPPGGLSVFGTGDLPGLGLPDLYMVKAYFNGLSGCNEVFGTSLQLPYPGPAPMMPAAPVGNINQLPNLMQGFIGIFDNTLCFNPVIGGGSNARTTPGNGTQQEDDAMLVLPNPAETGRAVTLQVVSEIEGPADIEIYDVLGKLYYSHSHTLIKGKNSLPVDISQTGMAAGIYTIKINGAGSSQTVQLMVK